MDAVPGRSGASKPSEPLVRANGGRFPMQGTALQGRVMTGALMAGLALLYIGAAKLGLELPVAFGNATPVWAPTGIALAALLIFGPSMWPGVAIGAFVANATTGIPISAAVGIALGNTLEAVVGSGLLRRADFRGSLDRVRDVIAFVILAATISTAVSASIGAASVTITDVIEPGAFGRSWTIWWLGDAMGALLVAPLLLVWLLPAGRRTPGGRLEAALLAALVLVVSAIVFFGGQWNYPYALFPLLVWSVLRFHNRGATAAIFVISGSAVWATVDGSYPISGITALAAVQILQGLMSVVSVSMLILGATIAEREKVAAALRESEERSRAIFQNSGVGIAMSDLDGRIVESNRVYRNMLGYTSKELRRMTFLDFTHEDDVDENWALFSELLEGKREWFVMEKRYVRKNGEVLWVRNTVSLIRDQNGAPRFSTAVVEDISERKRLEDVREQFIARASHELRTPLTSVVGFAKLLSRHRMIDEPTHDEIVEQLDKQAHRLSMMVNDLLDLTALQQGRFPMHPVPVAIAPLMQRVVESIPSPPGRTVEILARNQPSAHADPARLEEILANFLTNAYRYGGNKIWLEASVDDGGTTVSVTDDGEGVPPELVPNLFEPFARGENAAAIGGSGLGLSIVLSQARALGGDVRYEPREPHGARFTLWLPAAPDSG